MAGKREERKIRYGVEFLFRETKILKERDPIGAGAYGEIRYARCDSLLCAAKSVHSFFREEYELNPANRAALDDFEKEYAYLSSMSHPNIVQYLGYYVDHADDNKKYLLMELMDESLRHYLERLPGPVPFHKSIDFTHDIAMGLDYLHYNGIMHCDLSSNNVLLLAGCRAKISDFGGSILADVESGYRVRGKMAPGTPVYMPPEALKDNKPEFCSKLDNFSLGVLMIQILTRRWPEPSAATTIIKGDGPGSPDVELPVKESARRGSHLAMIDDHHPLKQLAIFCIKDDENERPDIREICNSLSEIKDNEPEYRASQKDNPTDPVRPTIASDQQFEELQRQMKELQVTNDKLESRVVQLQFVIGKQNELIEQAGPGGTRSLPSSVAATHSTGATPMGATPQPVVDQQTPRQRASTTPVPPPSSAPLPVQDLVLEKKKWKWYPCTKFPVPVYGGSAMTIGDRAYVTGQGLNVIHEYNPGNNSWVALPTAPNASFALVSIGGMLTTVGGYDKQSYSNALYSLVNAPQQGLAWQQSYPPMKDSRVSPGAASNDRYVVVAGGDSQVPGNRLLSNSVEILDIHTRTWSIADRLPKPVKRLSLTLCGDRVCVLGGISNKSQPLTEMFFASLQNLTSASSQRGLGGDLGRAFKFNNCWQTAGVPAVYGTCTVLGGYIVLVGGWSNNKLSNGVYMFDPTVQPPWRHLGPLAKPRMDAMCTVLSGDRLIVVGGRSHGQEAEPVLNFAEIAYPA